MTRKKLAYILVVIAVLAITIWLNESEAGDYHQDTQGHRVVYVVTDSSGNPVSGQTVRLQVQRVSDDAILDHSDNAFKYSGWTTRYATMTYNAQGEYYSRVVTLDTATTISGDYVMVVSNDDSTYGDQQAEVVMWDNLNNLIKIHR